MSQYDVVVDSIKQGSRQHKKAFDVFVTFFNEARDFFKNQPNDIPGLVLSDAIDGNGFSVKFAGRSLRFEYRFSNSDKNGYCAAINCYECPSPAYEDRVMVYSVPFKPNGDTNLIHDSDPVSLIEWIGPKYVVLLCLSKAIAMP